MRKKKLDAVVTPGSDISSVLAIGGFPGISVPAGFDKKGVPFGICFGGLKGSEPKRFGDIRKVVKMLPKRATTTKAMMVNEGNTSHAASKNEEQRTRRSTSRLIEEVEEIHGEEVSLKALLKRLDDLEKHNKLLMAENKAVREENEKRAEDAMYEKDGEELSSGTPVVRKSHVEEMRKNHHEEFSSINGVLYYTPQILELAGVGVLLSNMGISSDFASLLVSVVTTLLMLPCITVAMRLMDISGR
ncbi:hypothetical protein IFM89_027981, partial [Coptis chinensis]